MSETKVGSLQMTNKPFDNITEELFRQVSYAFERTDNANNPVKNGFLGNVGIELFQQAREAESGELGIFTRFLSYAIGQANLSRSQIAQDVWVDYMFEGRRGGRFLEIGAGDGVRDSNSYFLEAHRDWDGVLIEPNPSHAFAIQSTRAAEFIDKAMVADGSKFQNLAIMTDPYLSRLEGQYVNDLHDFRGGRILEKVVRVETIDFDELVDTYGDTGFDYISIDTEGSELELLNALPFDILKPALLTVEHNWSANSGAIFEALMSRGYQAWLAPFTRSDYFFYHTERLNEARLRLGAGIAGETEGKSFHFIPTDTQELRRQFEDAGLELARVKASCDRLSEEAKAHTDEVTGLETELASLKDENKKLGATLDEHTEEVRALRAELVAANKKNEALAAVERTNLGLKRQLEDAQALLEQERLLGQTSKAALTDRLAKFAADFAETEKRLLKVETAEKKANDTLAQALAKHEQEQKTALADKRRQEAQIKELEAQKQSDAKEFAAQQAQLTKLENLLESSQDQIVKLTQLNDELTGYIVSISDFVALGSKDYSRNVAQLDGKSPKSKNLDKDRLSLLLEAIKRAVEDAGRANGLAAEVEQLEGVLEVMTSEHEANIYAADQKLEVLENTLADLKARLEAVLAASESAKHDYENDIKFLQGEIAELKLKLNDALRGRSAAEDRVREAEGEKQAAIRDLGNTLASTLSGKAKHDAQVILDLAKRVQDLESSTSWKVTKPIRWATRLLRGR
jgi:FkbM family methyltransferase